MIKVKPVVLFDFDGTLVDSYESLVHVFTGAYKAADVELDPKVVTHLMRVQLPVGFKELKGNPEKYNLFCIKILELLDDKKTIELTKTFPDVIKTINLLYNKGYTLGIVTSNNVKHVKEVLTHLEININLFSVIIGNQEVKNHKPSPDPILKAIEILNVPSNNVCYVGDAMDDVNSSFAANVTPILLDRYNEYSNYTGYLIKSLEELQ